MIKFCWAFWHIIQRSKQSCITGLRRHFCSQSVCLSSRTYSQGPFCGIQMRFAIVGQARAAAAGWRFFSTCHTVVIAIRVFIRSRNFSLLHPTENLSDRPVTHSTFFLCNHNVFVFWVDLHIRKADRRFGLDVSSGGHFKDSRRHSRGADTRACNLSVLTPSYHPDRNGIPRFENYLFSLPN